MRVVDINPILFLLLLSFCLSGDGILNTSFGGVWGKEITRKGINQLRLLTQSDDAVW